MKKLIAMILLAALALSICACSPINKADVAVLWADGDTAVSPNSLINAMDRAMYIENIAYTYYGAGSDEAKQLQQANEAVAGGCAALMVEPVTAETTADFVALASAKDIPLVLFGANVDREAAATYPKCAVVMTYTEGLTKALDEMVSAYITDEKNAAKLDRNGDGTLDTVILDDMPHELDVSVIGLNFLEGAYDPTLAELIITDSDAEALDILLKLQAADLNTDKLKTQYVGLFTVGNKVDFKAYVLDGAPEGDARKAHLENNKFLCDLTTVEADDLDKMIFTTINVVDSGRITGTVMEDYDGIAGAAAAACAALLKGESFEAWNPVPYTAYTK